MSFWSDGAYPARRPVVDFGAPVGVFSDLATGRAALSSMTLHTGAANSGSGILVVGKMDIEGAERHALRGAGSVLAPWKPRILIDPYHLADGSTVLPHSSFAPATAATHGLPNLPIPPFLTSPQPEGMALPACYSEGVPRSFSWISSRV
jgi:hypothetical protein